MDRIRLILLQLKSIFANATMGYAGELHDKRVSMIVIDDYHATWPDEFEALKADLGEILGPIRVGGPVRADAPHVEPQRPGGP